MQPRSYTLSSAIASSTDFQQAKLHAQAMLKGSEVTATSDKDPNATPSREASITTVMTSFRKENVTTASRKANATTASSKGSTTNQSKGYNGRN